MFQLAKKLRKKPLEEKTSSDLEGKIGSRTFSFIPKYKRKRIFGTENEYGILWNDENLPLFISNGGQIYKDCGHLEYASPETSNPLEAVIYEKAGESLSLPYAEKLYKNNLDRHGNTFGTHENYFTKTDFDQLEEIIPFLITRQIFAGSGRLNGNRFDISQRAGFIDYAKNPSTTRDRSILCMKDEPLSENKGWHRLHLILGDANMCEIADFLKLGTTGLVLDLTEDGFLPKLDYYLSYAVSDLQNISKQTANWQLRGITKPTKATGIQRLYLKAALKHYSGRDEITDELLARWKYVLEALDKDPKQLVGTLDWVTKKALIDAYAEKEKLDIYDHRLRNIDLQYHDLDPKTSLFYQLQKAGKIERLVTDDLIEKATKNPPKDTRAYLRGRVVSYCDWKSISNRNIYWDNLALTTHKGHQLDEKILDPFSFTRKYFDAHPFNKFIRAGIPLGKNSELVIQLQEINDSLEEKYKTILEDFVSTVKQKTGLLISTDLPNTDLSYTYQDTSQFLDQFTQTLLDEDKIKDFIIPEEGYVLLVKTLGFGSNYYYGGTTDDIPLNQKVKILNKTSSSKWWVKAKRRCGCCYRNWYVHPKELELEEQKLDKKFKKAFKKAKHKKEFLDQYLSEEKQQAQAALARFEPLHKLIHQVIEKPTTIKKVCQETKRYQQELLTDTLARDILPLYNQLESTLKKIKT